MINSSFLFIIILTNPTFLHNPKFAPAELAVQLDSWMGVQGFDH
jgi:hypothetical protein